MEVLGLFLFLAMVLYLIDKNHGWPKFWRALKALANVALIAIFAGSGYSYWSNRHQRVTLDMSTAAPIDYAALANKTNGGTTTPPETLPANFNGWDAPKQMVPMFAPDGILRDAPSDRVNDAIAHGGHVAVWKKDRKGK